MIDRIKILDENIANKIAAGEVIERPASVVKELLENSIDAGSTKIEIKIKEGGLSWIQIIDNGQGMSRRDCELAFVRHATSKIQDTDDLYHLNTLGFRGEALPSIASISKIRLTSKVSGATEGTAVEFEGGKLIDIRPVGCPAGTEVIVREIFFNTPARKKYLKKLLTEASHIVNIVQKLALAHPEISLKLLHNGKVVFNSTGNGQELDILAQLYGLNIARELLPIQLECPELKLHGFIGKSFHHRSTRDHQILIVNGRYVRSSIFQRALESAYRSSIPINRYPMALLYLEIAPHSLDINVHPTKLEIKFSNEEKIFDSLTRAILKGIQITSHISNFPLAPMRKKDLEKAQKNLEDYVQFNWTEFKSVALPEQRSYLVPESKEDLTNSTGSWNLVAEKMPVFGREDDSTVVSRRFPELTAIGQLQQSFILAEGEAGLYIIDQHAAHERIKYEEYQKKAAEAAVNAQVLALPVSIELSSLESEALVANIIKLRELGIIVEHFGQNTFLVRAVPDDLGQQDITAFIMDIIAMLGKGNNPGVDNLKEGLIKLISCRQSVKAKKYLNLSEQQALINRLAKVINPFNCPHGRPTIIHFTLNELNKRFQRG